MHEFTHNQSAQSSDTTLEAPFGMWGRRINIQQWVAVPQDSLLFTPEKRFYSYLENQSSVLLQSILFLMSCQFCLVFEITIPDVGRSQGEDLRNKMMGVGDAWNVQHNTYHTAWNAQYPPHCPTTMRTLENTLLCFLSTTFHALSSWCNMFQRSARSYFLKWVCLNYRVEVGDDNSSVGTSNLTQPTP